MTPLRASAKPQPPSTSEAGFILPVALFVVVLMSMVVAAGLYASRNDLRAARAAREAARALVVADAGAARTVAMWNSQVVGLPLPGDSIVVDWQTLPDGSRYRSTVFRPPVGPDDPLRSTVVLFTTGESRLGSGARRTVANIVAPAAGFGPVCCSAGFRSGGRIRVDGDVRRDPVPEIDGRDRIPPSWDASFCPLPPADLPGLVATRARDVQLRRNGDVDGQPPVALDPTLNPATFTDLGGALYSELVGVADYVFTRDQRLGRQLGPVVSGGECNTSVNTNWGSPLDPNAACGSHFPVIHVAGDLRLDRRGVGQGILLVDGDLELRDEAQFFGIVVVLGTVELEDEARLHGGVLVRGDDDGEGRSEVKDEAKISYSSCAVQRAQAGLSGGSGAGSGAASIREWFEVIG